MGVLPLHFILLPYFLLLLQISFFLLVSFGLSPSCWRPSRMSGAPYFKWAGQKLWGRGGASRRVLRVWAAFLSGGPRKAAWVPFHFGGRFLFTEQEVLECRSSSDARDWGLWGLLTSFQLHVLSLCLVCPCLKSPWSHCLWEWASPRGEELTGCKVRTEDQGLCSFTQYHLPSVVLCAMHQGPCFPLVSPWGLRLPLFPRYHPPLPTVTTSALSFSPWIRLYSWMVILRNQRK